METRTALFVAVGGVAGAGLRWAITELAPTSIDWPVAVFVVNLLGSLLLGLILGRWGDRPADLVVAAATGFCGALTTFSSFAVDLAGYLRDDRLGLATSYLVLSLTAGLVVFTAGLLAGRAARAPSPEAAT